jgi:glc operon protein GlcG
MYSSIRFTLAVVILAATVVAAELPSKKILNLTAAKQIAAAAEAEAVKNNVAVVIAILDDGGNLLYFERMDETRISSVTVAQQKAYSAVTFKQPTKNFEEALANGRQAILKLPGAFPSEGGVPISVEGKVVGSIGVSGASSQQDGAIANAGVAALSK